MRSCTNVRCCRHHELPTLLPTSPFHLQKQGTHVSAKGTMAG